VRVTNTKNIPLFDVNVVFRCDIPNIDISRITIEPIKFNREEKVEIGRGTHMETGAIMYSGFDTQRYSWTVVLLRCLEPNFTANIKVESTLKRKFALEQNPNLFCEISDFSDVPSSSLLIDRTTFPYEIF
jgi:hypothetical protein